jgi:hypothetical protein
MAPNTDGSCGEVWISSLVLDITWATPMGP